MTESAVGEEEVVEAGLLQVGRDGRGGGSGRAVGAGGRGGAALGGRSLEAELEALEEGTPGNVDRLGVEFPLLVIVLKERGVVGVADAPPRVGTTVRGSLGARGEGSRGRIAHRIVKAERTPAALPIKPLFVF